MLIGIKDILKKAQRRKVAIGAFNVFNLESAQAVVEAAEELGAPVIVQTTPKAIAYSGIQYLADIIKKLAKGAKVPVVFHLDHGLNLETIADCLTAGYSSLMIDGSSLPFTENVAITKKAVEMADKKKVAMEGEIGTLSEHLRFTNPEEAEDFARQTKVNSLAVSVGSSHGHAPVEKLDLYLLRKIHYRVYIPLVLHGASGVSDEDIKGAIKHGVCKINIDTELREKFTGAVRKIIRNEKVVDPRDYLSSAKEAVKNAVKQKILLFGSINA